MNAATFVNTVIAYAIYYNAKYNLKKELTAEKKEKEKEKKKFQRQLLRCGGDGMNGVVICGKTYPWSRLATCKCGNKHPWMHGFPFCSEFVRNDSLYRVVCHRCFRHTDKGSYTQVVVEWNSRMKSGYQQIIDELKIIGVIRSSQ